MSNVLFVKANDRPYEQSISVQMYESFMNAYKAANPTDSITELDLFKEDVPYYGNDAITGLYKASQQLPLNDAEERMVNVIDKYMDQFLAADKIVIAFPLWNLTAPAPLITYMSYLTQSGKTFKYTAEGPIGLTSGKKIMLLSARGGDYASEGKQYIESGIKPVKAILGGLLGIPIEEVVIEGHQEFSDRAADIISSGLVHTQKAAAGF
ncbi:FMN-dependent NADH-azoreductase [Paenibacillus albus]|uniref:FMN dependent NADH:quinone oxidoreductase n=1 Tax=Paenibacillus albus TaxID=2495582 RepID=A0A3Q8X488_9BACL|nr:FMN-dependent NADH-azoreductase [Paenibacillus albus]AZN40052.1 FMN-dependent NADH-azoreductase [Paenibacillus albus]